MKKIFLLAFVFLIFRQLFAQNTGKFLKTSEWNAYSQIRFTTDFNDNYNFSLRRLKVWLKSSPDFSEHWSYKIQTTLSSLKNENFFLQDVKLGYKADIWSLDIGQFVPEYSLQRFQSDYLLPVTERAKVINSLIPNGTLGVRDIGIQTNIKTKNNVWQTHFGIFNGYGIKEYRLNNKGVMLTNKSELNLQISKGTIKTGYSLMFRKADNQIYPKIMPDTILYSGNDFRYNLFLMYKTKFFEIQGEYLTAVFDNNQHSEGYYIMFALNLKKHQIVLAYEDYKDIISSSSDFPYYHIGYNYLINKHKIKLFFDNDFQIINNKIQNYLASVQLQVFFKQN